MTSEPVEYDDDCEVDDCWECNGDGGWARCQEDSCPHIYGEEGCDDPVCWHVCPTCKGRRLS